MEDLRYQHMYHPQPIEQKCPALARVLDVISSGTFGDGGVYEPLLNTVRQNDYYLLTEDFDSCEHLMIVFRASLLTLRRTRRHPSVGPHR